MKRYFALLFVMALLCACTPRTQDAVTQEMPVENLLENPGFEEGWTRETIYWTPDGGPFYNPFGEIFTPDDWVTWWREGFPCATAYTFKEGRPEVQVIDKTADASRVRSGNKATKMFTFWRCHDFGLLQQVPADVGATYDFEIFPHAWYSDCSSKPYEAPLAKDCVTPLTDSWDYFYAGIDPTGGVDPMASTVEWGEAIEQYGHYYQQAEVRNVKALSSTITVFFRSECNYPLKHSDVYIDDALLTEVDPTHTIYLPLILKED